MTAFEVKFENLDQTVKMLAAVGTGQLDVIRRSMNGIGEEIKTRSQQLVPVVTGNLKSSAHVIGATVQGTEVWVVIGYGDTAVAYAFAVHENPRAGKTGGISPGGKPYSQYSKVGEWKYLETPVNEALPQIDPIIARDLQRYIDEKLR